MNALKLDIQRHAAFMFAATLELADTNLFLVIAFLYHLLTLSEASAAIATWWHICDPFSQKST